MKFSTITVFTLLAASVSAVVTGGSNEPSSQSSNAITTTQDRGGLQEQAGSLTSSSASTHSSQEKTSSHSLSNSEAYGAVLVQLDQKLKDLSEMLEQVKQERSTMMSFNFVYQEGSRSSDFGKWLVEKERMNEVKSNLMKDERKLERQIIRYKTIRNTFMNKYSYLAENPDTRDLASQITESNACYRYSKGRDGDYDPAYDRSLAGRIVGSNGFYRYAKCPEKK